MLARLKENQTRAKSLDELWAEKNAWHEKDRLREAALTFEKQRQANINAALKSVPERFLGKTFSDFIAESLDQKKVKETAQFFVKSFSKRLKSGDPLIFKGRQGTGKTLLSLIIHQEVPKQGFRSEYQPSLNFLRFVQEKQYESHAAFQNILDYYRQLPLLVIDEVTEGCGKGAYPADWERHLLRMLIDERYQNRRCTIVITNRAKEELIERIGEQTFDRLSENGATLAFTWGSHRQR